MQIHKKGKNHQFLRRKVTAKLYFSYKSMNLKNPDYSDQFFLKISHKKNRRYKPNHTIRVRV